MFKLAGLDAKTMISQLQAICLGTLNIAVSSFAEQLVDGVLQKHPTILGYDVYPNLAFVGFQDFSNASTVQTVEQCAHLCNATRTCMAFIFEGAEKYCRLKSGIGTWHKHNDVLTCVKELRNGTTIAADEEAHEEELIIIDELATMGKLPPLHPGKDCFEVCGNQSGWCSWCGMAKACCSPKSVSRVCSRPPAGFVTFGHECITPRNSQLKRLGIAHFSFQLEGFDYAAVLTFEWLRDELINTVKAAVVKLLLHTSRVQQVSVDINSHRRWVGVKGIVMIPEGGPAAGYLAETRLCFSAHSMSLSLEKLVLQTPGINLGKRSAPEGEIKLKNFALAPGKPCSTDVLMDFNSKSWIEFSHFENTTSLTFLLSGALLGWLAACCFFGLCHRYCREKTISRKLPSNVKRMHSDSSSYCEISPQASREAALSLPGSSAATGPGFAPRGQTASSMTYFPANRT